MLGSVLLIFITNVYVFRLLFGFFFFFLFFFLFAFSSRCSKQRKDSHKRTKMNERIYPSWFSSSSSSPCSSSSSSSSSSAGGITGRDGSLSDSSSLLEMVSLDLYFPVDFDERCEETFDELDRWLV